MTLTLYCSLMAPLLKNFVDIFISRKYHDLERIKEIMSCLLRGEDPAGVEQVPLRHVEFCLLSQLKAAGISVSQ